MPSQHARALAAAGLIIICFVAWLAFEIPKGILANSDELFTAERAREMLLTEPWVVHFNFQRSFEKPPLQYWLTTLTLPRFQNRTLAVRIWPLIYAGLTAIAVAWLAFLVEPAAPWLIPLTVAILASSPIFSAEAGRALLDIGLAFFTTTAILFAQLARKRPAWWLAVAVACWLGALQKIPLIFLVWLLIVSVRLISKTERRRALNAWLIAGIIFAIAATAIWPVVQLVKYEMPLQSIFREEVGVWLGRPEHLGARPYFEIPFRLITTAWIGGGLLALVTPFVIIFWKRPGFPAAAREISILCLSMIALAVVFNFRSVRYMVPITPCLCLLLALIVHRFLERPRVIRIGTAIFLAVFLLVGVVQAKLQIQVRRKNVADEKRVAEELGSLQREDAEVRPCCPAQSVLIQAVQRGQDLLFDSFYLFHGNLRLPVVKYTVDEIRQTPPEPPIIGVCVTRDFPVIQTLYPNVEVQFTRAQFILWRVTGPQ
jgi:4-amino-4-deoxy-L-arabinose transferase-like glycosyltransferase